MGRTIAIIGGGAAGASAAARARKLDPQARVVLFERGPMITHAPCGIPYAVAGIVKDHERLQTYTPEEFSRDRNIEVYTNSEVTQVDVGSRTLTALVQGSARRFSWDRLIIATGAKPLVPPISGVDLKGILTVRLPPDTPRLKEELGEAKTVAIVGSGYIGVEMAEAMLHLGKKVLIFEVFDKPLPQMLDNDVARIVAEEMASKGADLHLNEKVVEFKGREHVELVVTERGEYKVDKVVLAVGVRPDTKLAREIGARLGETGAIYVDEYMETSVPDVFAAGDAAETVHRVTGMRVWIPLAPAANKMGQVAGANAARTRSIRFPGVTGTSITKFFDLYIAKTGLNEGEASRLGIRTRAALIRARSTAGYYPGGSPVYVKMIVGSDDRVIGVQVVGYDKSVAGYIDVAAVLIERGATIEDVFFSDLSYMPATAPVWHPLIVAARVLSQGRF